jgi:hypothetical protein
MLSVWPQRRQRYPSMVHFARRTTTERMRSLLNSLRAPRVAGYPTSKLFTLAGFSARRPTGHRQQQQLVLVPVA